MTASYTTPYTIGETVRVKGNGLGMVIGAGYHPGDAILVEFPDGQRLAYPLRDLQKVRLGEKKSGDQNGPSDGSPPQ